MHRSQYKAGIEACESCANACDHCTAACLQEVDVKRMARCIALTIDCAAICRLAAGAMARDSEMVRNICKACADICEACANECRKFDTPHCKECADACMRCAKLCLGMADY